MLFFGYAALTFYLLGTATQILTFTQRLQFSAPRHFLLAIVSLGCHAGFITLTWTQSGALDLGFFAAASLIAWLIVFLLTLIVAQRPVTNLFLAAYPIAFFAVGCQLLFDQSTDAARVSDPGIMAHIILSVLAYSIFTLTAVQALLVYQQNRQLKTNYNGLLIRNLPPLQTMENLLFEMLWTGMILLTLAILMGGIYVEDLFAQHLAHKTVLSIISWLVFAALLAGHRIYGWRGLTASRWTLWGCFFLMLAFFGSKFALEVILDRGI